MVRTWSLIICGYLLGSLLPAEWIVRWRTGHTLQELGDNPGAAGTWRQAGLPAALIVLLLDLAKGALPLLLARRLNIQESWLPAVGVAPVAGHNWPLYRRFRGGRGLGPASGALLVLAGRQMLPAYLLGAIAALWQRWVPAVGVVAFPLGLLLMRRSGVSPARMRTALAIMLAVVLSNVPSFWQEVAKALRR